MLLSYDDNGPGPVVVLLHGFPFDRTMWSGQIGEVGGIYRLIIPDLRGHGQSVSPPDRIYPMDAMADDLIETLDALNIREKVVLGGLSMGGYIALSAVRRYPERFRGLMLLDTKAAADSPEMAKGREATADQVEASGATEGVVEAMISRVFSASTRELRPELVAPVREVMLKTSPRTIAACLRGMASRPDRTRDLMRINIPTLVLVGGEDVVTPIAEARAMVEELPNATLAIVADAGHLAPLENRAASNLAILSFLQRLG